MPNRVRRELCANKLFSNAERYKHIHTLVVDGNRHFVFKSCQLMNYSAIHGCVWWRIFWHYLFYRLSERFYNIVADYTWNSWFSYQKKFIFKRATQAMFRLCKQPDGRCIFLKTSKAEDHQNVMCIHIAICRKTSFWKMGRTGLKFCASYIIRATHNLQQQKIP